MKKTVLAAVAGAALIMTGMAQAGSSVTLYGVGDAWVGSKPSRELGNPRIVERGPNSIKVKLDRIRQTAIESGGLSGSRLGVLVKEDLGSGLTAFANFESGINLDDGSNGQGGLGFGRKSVIGLGSASWGKVTLGRQYTAYDDIMGMVSAQGNDSFDAAAGRGGIYQSHMTAVGLNDDGECNVRRGYCAKIAEIAQGVGVTLTSGRLTAIAHRLAAASLGSDRVGAWVGYQGRYNNSIRYDSPNFSGFSGAIAVGLGENKTATSKATNNVSLHLKYANGPLTLAFAHQIDKGGLASIVANQPVGELKNTLIGGSYDFGMLKAHLAFNKAGGNTGDKAKEWLLGMTAPIAGKYQLVGQLAHSKMDMGMKSLSFGLEGHYSLSKRTTAYAAWNHTRTELLNQETKADTYGAGMRHRF